jgi:hypothetical protein
VTLLTRLLPSSTGSSIMISLKLVTRKLVKLYCSIFIKNME